MPTYAYQYGLGDPLDWGDDANECLWLQNKLWNRLVEIEQANRAAYFALTAEDAQVADVNARIDALTAEIDAAMTARKAARAAARKKVPTPELDERIAQLAATRKALAADAKALRLELRERLAEPLRALSDERFAAVKKARQESGLFWGHYNAVIASYETARVRAMKAGVSLKFHGFTGEGRFTNQIQGGVTAEGLLRGECSQVRIGAISADAWAHPSRGERRRLCRTTLSITVHRDGEHRLLTFPMSMHRPLPDGAMIKQVVVTRRKVGTRFEHAAVFTLNDPVERIPNDASRVCGINPGFRQVADGLRVAMRIDNRGREAALILPTAWIERMRHVDDLQGRLDVRINEIHAALRAWWRADDTETEAERVALSEPVRERIVRIAAAPKIGPGKLAALSLAWRAEWEAVAGARLDERGGAPSLLGELESWRKWDKRKREEMDGLRGKLLRERREIYRVYAAQVAQDHAVVGITDMDFAKMAQIETRDGEETPLGEKPRSNRFMAAPSELVGALKVACSRHGAQFVPVVGAASACHACGGVTVAGADLMHTCPHCGAHWDQDINAACNACHTAAGGESAAGALAH